MTFARPHHLLCPRHLLCPCHLPLTHLFIHVLLSVAIVMSGHDDEDLIDYEDQEVVTNGASAGVAGGGAAGEDGAEKVYVAAPDLGGAGLAGTAALAIPGSATVTAAQAWEGAWARCPCAGLRDSMNVRPK